MIEPGAQWIRQFVADVDIGGGYQIKMAQSSDTPYSAQNKNNFYGFRIVFDIQKAEKRTSNKAEVILYNLSADTMDRIKKEFTGITLRAGYEVNPDIIFKGNLTKITRGKENGINSFIKLSSGDGDQALNFGTINRSFPRGTTLREQIKGLAQTFQEFDVEEGYIETGSDSALGTSKTMSGMSRDFLDELALSSESTWSIQNKKLNFLPLTSSVPSSLIVVSPQSGLIASPEWINGAVKFTTLLNPRFDIGHLTRLENTEFADGTYRILKVRYFGDSFGNDWKTEIVALRADITKNRTQQVTNQ